MPVFPKIEQHAFVTITVKQKFAFGAETLRLHDRGRDRQDRPCRGDCVTPGHALPAS